MRSVLSIFLLLIILPLLFLGGTAGYVYLTQPSPYEGLFTCTVDRPVLWPGNMAEIRLHRNGDQLGTIPTSPFTTDVLLVIDRSGSMGNGPGSPLDGARSAAANFASTLGSPTFRIGVVAFNHRPDTVRAVSSDVEAALDSITSIRGGGGTDITSALRLAGQELEKAPIASPPVERQAIILLSDGLDRSQSAVVGAAKELKRKGVDIFAIGLGHSIDESLLRQLASHPHYYTRTLNPKELASIYLEFGGSLADKLGYKGQVVEQFNTRLFDLPKEPSILLTQYDPDQGVLQWSLPILFPRPMTLKYRLSPRLAGVLAPASEPATLTYASLNHEVKSIESGHHPKVLALTWPLLLLLFLPAILYILYKMLQFLVYLLRPKPKEEELRVPRPKYKEPPVLTDLPKLPDLTLEPVPTLFVGLGWTGRWVLTHMKYVLKEIFGGEVPKNFQFLCLDTAKTEYEGTGCLDIRMDTAELLPDEILCLPADLREQVQSLAESGHRPVHLRWFEPHRYRDLPVDNLDLARGSHGRRGLARLALIKDLEKSQEDSQICGRLNSKLSDLFQSESSSEEYQMFLVASAAGGVGSGWFTDIAYLGRRFAREIAPDRSISCYGFLAGAGPERDSREALRNIYALLAEINRISFSGEFPTPMDYSAEGAGDDGLRGVIDGLLFERLYFFSKSESLSAGEPPERSVFAEIADTLSLFCEKSILNNLKDYLQNLNVKESSERNRLREYTVSTSGTSTIRFPVQLVSERLKYHMLLHLFGGGRFLDLHKSGDRVTFHPVSTDLLKGILQEWGEQEFMEQDCPLFFRCLREFCERENSPSIRDVISQMDTALSLEDWLREDGERYGKYLQMVLTPYLRGGYEDAPDLWVHRCGRVGKIYQLFDMLFERSEAFRNHLSSQLSLETDQGKIKRLDALAELYQKINSDMLDEMERWAFALIGPEAIEVPKVAAKPEGKGFYTTVAKRYEDLKSFESHILWPMKCRWYLSDEEGEKGLGEERFFSEQISPWIEGTDGLLGRLWFEAVPSRSEKRFAPSLRLIFIGQERKVFHLDQEVPKALDQELGNICARKAGQIVTSTVVRKLRGESETESKIIPETVSKRLKNARPALRLSETYLRSSGASGPIRTQIFSRLASGKHPAELDRRYTEMVQDLIRRHTTDQWQQLSCDIQDTHSYLLCTMLDNFPIGAISALEMANHSRETDPGWDQAVEYVYEPEVRLREYACELEKISGYRAPRFHPLMGVMVMDHILFRHFALLWAFERIQFRRTGIVNRYVVTLKDSEIPLTEGSETPDLLEAVLRFRAINKEDFARVQNEIEFMDQNTILEQLDRIMRQIEEEDVHNMRKDRQISIDEQVKLLIYTELSLETRRH